MKEGTLDLVDWFNRSVEEESHHPLILIGIFIVVFLAIDPFKDGNGRLSRVLISLLLLRAGYGYVPYSSMEGVIEQNKDSCQGRSESRPVWRSKREPPGTCEGCWSLRGRGALERSGRGPRPRESCSGRGG
jgi:hypothetical protein